MQSDYSLEISQQMMTLSSIVYVDDGTHGFFHLRYSLEDIAKAIDAELANSAYVTKAQWARVWGPVRSPGFFYDNLIFLAHNRTTGAYALVVRGTAASPFSVLEDLPIDQVDFPYTITPVVNAKVSSGFLSGMVSVLKEADGSKGTLIDYIKTLDCPAETPFYVTGHSQGGGLTPMFLSFMMNQAQKARFKDCFTFTGYAFAAPTSGTPEFASYISTQTSCHMVTNPLDIVPHGYAGMMELITDKIPTTVPASISVDGHNVNLVKVFTDFADYCADIGSWAQPTTQQTLPAVHFEPDGNYIIQAGAQHNHDNYLALLDTPKPYPSLQSALDKLGAKVE